MRSEGKGELPIVKPGDGDGFPLEMGGLAQRIMSALLETHVDLVFRDGNARRGFDEVAEDTTGGGRAVRAADVETKQAVAAAGHEGALEVAIDLHGHRRSERIHVEAVSRENVGHCRTT